jgi:hypothetical protein
VPRFHLPWKTTIIESAGYSRRKDKETEEAYEMSINACDLHRWAVWRREKSTSATNDVDDWTFFFSSPYSFASLSWHCMEKSPCIYFDLGASPPIYILFTALWNIKGIHTFKPIHHQSSHLISWGSLLFHPQIYTITTTTTYNKTVLVLYTTTLALQHFAVAVCCPADRLKQPQSSKKKSPWNVASSIL